MQLIIDTCKALAFAIGILTMCLVGGDGVGMTLTQEFILKGKILLVAIMLIAILMLIVNILERVQRGRDK